MSKKPLRERLALSFSPLILRLMLAITFMWAGAIKFGEVPVTDQADIATLVKLDVFPPPADGVEVAAVMIKRHESIQLLLENAAHPKPVPVTSSADANTSEDQTPLPLAGTSEPDTTGQPDNGSEPPTSEIDDATSVLSTRTPMPIWPAALSGATMTKVFALALVGTEFLGGFLMLIGLMTRFAALGLIGAMLGAMWLTQFGPAIQNGDALLGFLPNNNWADVSAWQGLFWQFALLAASAAVLFSGPGSCSVDGRLFNPGPSPYFDDDDDDEDDD
ncbi:MAG: DoxX family protein [Phycisphaeraceae bacterium]|nr:DoxX family protein [Phycisphaerales bacterium]MCB9860087.1 DoxX family protein [Phycisphaeraceae bacterium]